MISPFVWVDIIRFQHSLPHLVFVFFVFFVFFRDPPSPSLTGGESGVSLRLGRVAVAVAVVLFAHCGQLGGRLTGMEIL